MKTKQEAQEAADKLLKKMKGSGWKARVWENMGWHYKVSTGNLYVWPIGHGQYMAGLGDNPALLSWHVKPKVDTWPIGTPSYWHDAKSYKDPNAAAQAQVKRARDFVNAQTLIVIDVEASAGISTLGIEKK